MMQVKTAPVHSVTVVVPCFNEERRLNADTFIAFVRRFPYVHVLFVDDGSTDNTRRKLQNICAEHLHALTVLVLPENAGKAEAVRQGLLQALSCGPAYVAFWDADLATPLEELFPMLDIMEHQHDVSMVVGSRVRLLGRSIERNMIRHYLGRIFATVTSLILQLPLYDTQCGAKLLRVTPELPSLLLCPFISRWIFDVELFARIAEQASRDSQDVKKCIIEHPLQTWREQGKTTLHFRDVLCIPWDLLRIAWVIRRGHKIPHGGSLPDAEVMTKNE